MTKEEATEFAARIYNKYEGCPYEDYSKEDLILILQTMDCLVEDLVKQPAYVFPTSAQVN